MKKIGFDDRASGAVQHTAVHLPPEPPCVLSGAAAEAMILLLFFSFSAGFAIFFRTLEFLFPNASALLLRFDSIRLPRRRRKSLMPKKQRLAFHVPCAPNSALSGADKLPLLVHNCSALI